MSRICQMRANDSYPENSIIEKKDPLPSNKKISYKPTTPIISNKYEQHLKHIMEKKKTNDLDSIECKKKNITNKYKRINDIRRRKSYSINTSIKENRGKFEERMHLLEDMSVERQRQEEEKRHKILSQMEQKQNKIQLMKICQLEEIKNRQREHHSKMQNAKKQLRN